MNGSINMDLQKLQYTASPETDRGFIFTQTLFSRMFHNFAELHPPPYEIRGLPLMYQ